MREYESDRSPERSVKKYTILIYKYEKNKM